MLESNSIVLLAADGPDLLPSRHGLKACGLQTLIRSGLRVPSAFVIPTGTSEVVAAGGRARELSDAIAEITGDSNDVRLAVRPGGEDLIPGAFQALLDVAPEEVGTAIETVIKSTKGLRAMTIARQFGHHSVPESALVVQRQVNAGAVGLSGAGIAESRDAITGDVGLNGPFAWGASGPELSKGTVAVLPIVALAERAPELLAELDSALAGLDQQLDGPVRVEVTIESGSLWYLELGRLDPIGGQVPVGATDFVSVASGTPVSSGVGRGSLHVDVDSALDAIEDDQRVVLALRSSSPGDVGAMEHCAAVLTVLGGPESHAAIVSRSAGVPAVLSVQGLVMGDDHIMLGGVRVEQGETLVVDGATGRIAREAAST